jgi:hypothetical protein
VSDDPARPYTAEEHAEVQAMIASVYPDGIPADDDEDDEP